LARIALDAMGGDHAPHATVAGALLALAELNASHSLQLVGRTEVIRRELDSQLARGSAIPRRARERVTIIEAPQVIEMSDRPAAVLRTKAKSSIAVGLKLQVAGESDAFVSAGNTGAQMAASTLILKLHEGLTRPAIGTVFPTVNHPVVVLDSGANVDCTAEELVQFARLGATYAEDILGRKNPSVGLLSIGEEPEKGNAAVKEAHQALLESDLNFQGNVEGRDILTGATDRGPIDVVVCDGFVGNVLLKFYESVPPMVLALLARAGIDPVQLRRAFSKEFDYAEHGGAPLLGVRGVSIISHGKSSPNAIKNAILVALRAVESRLTEHIGRRLSQSAKESA
jgi:glycerol-3-phosphate acyltransferase PlsX